MSFNNYWSIHGDYPAWKWKMKRPRMMWEKRSKYRGDCSIVRKLRDPELYDLCELSKAIYNIPMKKINNAFKLYAQKKGINYPL